MTWFKQLTDCDETSPEQVRNCLRVEGEWLYSNARQTRWRCGRFETPSLHELRQRTDQTFSLGARNQIRIEVANVQNLHRDAANAGVFFQVASQFNLLEMISPRAVPEDGVGIYEQDYTQGPACAIAAGAGTIYRNYFVPIGPGLGQSRDRQIDCLRELGEAVGNERGRFWRMVNGYALPSAEGLAEVERALSQMSEAERDDLRGKLRIGLQLDTEVTLGTTAHLVSQAYCSALPVAYSGLNAAQWKGFAMLVLEAAYEATLRAAIENANRTGNPVVYLTLLGGGAFGNEPKWILQSLKRAVLMMPDSSLDIVLVSFKSPQADLVQAIDSIKHELEK